jgi:hypothetical protein
MPTSGDAHDVTGSRAFDDTEKIFFNRRKKATEVYISGRLADVTNRQMGANT